MDLLMPDFRITFIIPDKCKDESEVSEIMVQAYDNAKHLASEVSWSREKDLDVASLTKKDYIIVDDITAGKRFEQLTDAKFAILGPWVLSVCFLENKPIPRFNWFMYNVAFYNCVISCSNLSKQHKFQIKEMVQLMGGCYADSLIEATTHLITENICTAKYVKAAQSGKKVMLPTWIDAVWEASQLSNVHANDEKFMNYRCLPFHNLVISSTGITNPRERTRLTETVAKNGGELIPTLKLAVTKFLICHGPAGTTSEKFKAAQKSQNIQCVTLDWIYDSVEKGYALPPEQYYVKAATSTPVKDTEVPDPDFSTLSVITQGGPSERSTIDESANLTNLMSGTNHFTPVNKGCRSSKRKGEFADLLDGIDFKKIKQSGHFLEHCSICILGFDREDREKLNRAISLSGATRYDNVSDCVTHVIVGDTKCPEVKQILDKGNHFYVVNTKWFFDSMEQQQPAREDGYMVKIVEPENRRSGSPLSKKEFNLMASYTNFSNLEEIQNEMDKEFEPQQSLKDNEMPGTETLAELLANADDFTNNKENTNAQINEDSTKTEKTINNDNISKHVINLQDTDPSNVTPDTTCTITQEDSESVAPFFYGTKFAIVGFEHDVYEELRAKLEGLNAGVVPKNFKGIPDYALVPAFPKSSINPTAQEAVTEAWVNECIYHETIVDIKYYHRPIVLNDSKPLKDCVVTISGYSSFEREFLKELVVSLGGLDQDALARTTNLKKGVIGCTHLVSLDVGGKKYEAAKKWGIHIVNIQWLLECAKTGECASEQKFMLKEATVENVTPKNDTTIKNGQSVLKENASTSKVATPISTKMTHDDNPKTPVNQIYKFSARDSPGVSSQITPVSKILQEAREKKLLNSVPRQETPKICSGPWDMKTPETPYGAAIVPNPSKEMRKEMLFYINSLPDFSPPKRRLSTPLSEIKKKLRRQLVAQSSQNRLTNNGEENISHSAVKNDDGEDEDFEDDSTNHSDEVFRQHCKEWSTDSVEKQVTDNALINNKLQQLEEMLTAQGSSSSSRRASKAFQPSLKTDGETNSEVMSQVCTVGWDFREDEQNNMDVNKDKPKIFMISGIVEPARSTIESQIDALGGTVSDLQNFDPACTHLIIRKTTRNEKILSSMASGKWILHQNYIERSYAAGAFLDEEEFEFGNPKSATNIPNEYVEEDTLSRNIYWWRKEISKRGYGAFNDMRAIVVANKREPLIRVIEAGGGVVVNLSPPFEDTVHVTHCLIEPKTVLDTSLYVPLAQQGVRCASTVYLSDFLHRKENDCILPDFAKYYRNQ